ncbi:MAG: DEAD/DEAH box helicase [Sulfolobaceae archaeon]|nr:DEAD/DEAH box helicase [Sulfolobaceae archaeon]
MEIDQRILTLIEKRGWKSLNEIQMRSYKPILENKNVLIIAPTGYGKTEAAILPILDMMLDINPEPVAVLYITPLKALINDLTNRIKWWASYLGFRVGRKHGEVPQKEKNMRLKNAPHILITTPEGLEIDLDWASRFRENYKNIRWVIVDEIHELISSKRGAQLSVLLERLKNYTGYDFQRIGISATLSNEDEVLKFLIGSSTRQAEIVKIPSTKNFRLKVLKVKLNNEDSVWTESAKIIKNEIKPPTLIFTDSRFTTERLHEELEKLVEDGVYVHHSSISREIKDDVEKALKENNALAVICTKTLELGIDIGAVKNVILFRPPPSVFSFLQRIGRSGHSINETSEGEVLCIYDTDVLESLALYSLAKKRSIEKLTITPYLDVVAREIVGMTLQNTELDINTAYEIIKKSYVYRKLDYSKFMEIVKYLEFSGLIKIEENKNIIKIGNKFFKIWRFNKDKKNSWVRGFSEFFSFIVSDDTFSVKYNENTIGEIDAMYVYKHLRVGDIIRISGKLWKIQKIEPLKMSIQVQLVNGDSGEIPIWRGDVIPKSDLLPYEISSIIKNNEVIKDGSLILDQEALKTLINITKEYKERNLPLPSDDIMYIEKNGEDEWIYTVLTSEKITNTIAHALLYLAMWKYGLNVYSRASIYGFAIKGPTEDLFKTLLAMPDDKIKEIIIKGITRSPLFLATIKEVQYSFGKIGKISSKEDKLILKEALKQTIRKYFSVSKTLKFLNEVKDGKIKIIDLSEEQQNNLTPLARAVLLQAAVRPWFADIYGKISQVLKGGAFTLKELSEAIGLSEKSLESKLKQMRKPDSKFRVINFIDVDDEKVRWCLADELKNIAESEEFASSFTPINENETYIVTFRPFNSSSSMEFIIKVKDLLDDNIINKKIPFEELEEIRVKDPNDSLFQSISPKFFYVNRKNVKYILLNAITYIQSLKYL